MELPRKLILFLNLAQMNFQILTLESQAMVLHNTVYYVGAIDVDIANGGELLSLYNITNSPGRQSILLSLNMKQQIYHLQSAHSGLGLLLYNDV